MILQSNFKALCPVPLPPMTGRQHYMHTFDLSKPTVPPGFEDYLGAVKLLCWVAGANVGLAHLTVDEKIVKAGMSQRRPGPHVDGCFVPGPTPYWGHQGPEPQWLHDCNNISLKAPKRMPVIVAASVPGCRAWRGLFDGIPKNDGDLSHISDQLKNPEVLPAYYGYLLSPDCVHESLVFGKDTPRTLIRIALPNDFSYMD